MMHVNSTRFNVTKADLPATAIGQNITSSDNAAFFITVPEDFTGNVNIIVDGKTYSGPVQSLITMDKLSVGSKTAEVKFYGDANYNDLNLTASFNVVDPGSLMTILSIKSDNMTRGYNSEFDYQVVFLDAKGNVLKNTEVTFKVNGKTYKAKTNKKGLVKVVIKNKKVLKKLKKGKTYTVKVTYSVKHKFGNGYQTVNDVVKCKVKIKK